VAARVIEALDQFAETGRGDVTRLRGESNELRLRVGDWRLRFRLAGENNSIIEVIRMLPRGRAYRD
jgi:mRNA interferase RelE/StbE